MRRRVVITDVSGQRIGPIFTGLYGLCYFSEIY
jgi:hypothetical protein